MNEGPGQSQVCVLKVIVCVGLAARLRADTASIAVRTSRLIKNLPVYCIFTFTCTSALVILYKFFSSFIYIVISQLNFLDVSFPHFSVQIHYLLENF
jgi:hypothetical protein